jgi:DNA polymerase-3 subunit gamma/tau
MSTLYRKYRPQKFADLIGQEHLVQTLTNEIATGTIAHAYLFSGPRGIGKTTMARLLAKAVNCENRTDDKFEPCDECSSCKEISASRNIDVIEIDAASNTGVDNVRENIIDNAQFKPTKSKYKVFIIDEVHMLSTSSFNALLKTLEEPPAHVVFVLATTELHKLPATIVSRCQRFNFKKIPEDIMIKKLHGIAENENVKVDKEVLRRVVAKSDGCMRDAESLLGQVMSLNLKKIGPDDAAAILPLADIETALEYVKAIADYDTAGALAVIDRLIKEGANLDQFALDVITVLRAIMIAASGQSAFGDDYTDKDKKKIRELAAALESGRLIRLIDAAIRRRYEIKQAPVPQLPLELLAVEFSDKNHHDNTPATPPTGNEIKTGAPAKPEPKQADKSAELTVAETTPLAVTKPAVGSLIIEDIKSKWQEVIAKMSETMHSLTFVLKMAEIVGTEGDKIFITVPYSFHKEKVDDIKCKKAIEDCLSDLLSRRVAVSCRVKEPGLTASNDAEITNLAVEFGGEVVA